jgi:hypothetical protein
VLLSGSCCQFGVAGFEFLILPPQGLQLLPRCILFFLVLLDESEAVLALLLQVLIFAGESVVLFELDFQLFVVVCLGLPDALVDFLGVEVGGV